MTIVVFCILLLCGTAMPAAALGPQSPRAPSQALPQLTADALVFLGSEAGRQVPLGVSSGAYLFDTDARTRIGEAVYLGGLRRRRTPLEVLRRFTYKFTTYLKDRRFKRIVQLPYEDTLYEMKGQLLRWSPDGTKVAFVTACEDETTVDTELYMMNADGSGLTNVSQSPAPDVILCSFEPVTGGFDWSADSRSLVFWSLRQPAGLYVVNADGTGLRYLTAGTHPAWSPTGDAVVFITNPRLEDVANWEIPVHTIDIRGTNKRLQTTVPPTYSGLDGWVAPDLYWSPDGSLLAFAAIPQRPDFTRWGADWEQHLHLEVLVMKADGTDLLPITGGDAIANWVDCRRRLPTAGCEVRVSNAVLQPLSALPYVRIPYGQDPERDQPVAGLLSSGATGCLLGSPALVDGVQWWPVRTGSGRVVWAVAVDPQEPYQPWLTATGRLCQKPREGS